MLETLHTNPTQLTGLVAFGLAALACLRASRQRRAPWLALMAAQWLCFAEIAFTTRFLVHDMADGFLRAHDAYEGRTPWQIALLVLVSIPAAACLRAASRWRSRDADARRALLATVVAVTLFVVESVSLHQIDTVMHAQVGPIVAIALGWSSTAAVVVFSALRAARGRS